MQLHLQGHWWTDKYGLLTNQARGPYGKKFARVHSRNERTKTTEGQYSSVRLEQARLIARSLLLALENKTKYTVWQNTDKQRTNQSDWI